MLLPVALYIFLFRRAAISRLSVAGYACLLIAMAGIDVYLLQTLADLARQTSSQLDDRIFVSELSVALYLLPAVFAGIGVNLLSHVLIDHLHRAEGRYERDAKHGGGLR